MQERVLRQNNDRATVRAQHTVFAVILAISFCHLLNDMMQALLPAIYPNLKADFGLSFGQVGIVSLVYQVTASILQPLVGLYADRRPTPLALPSGSLFSLAGLLVLSIAHGYSMLLAGASLLGVGSSVFHPESSRVARMAAGGRHGLAQSLFQVGGNVGQALGPLAAALVVVRWGQSSLAFFALLALVSGAILWNVGVWYKHHGLARLEAGASHKSALAALPPASVEVRLPGESEQLLHILLDSSVRLVGAQRAARAVCVRRCGRGRHRPRRPVWRSHRPQARHLVLDPRNPAVHADAALR
jgi:MFS family permease